MLALDENVTPAAGPLAGNLVFDPNKTVSPGHYVQIF